MTDEKSNELLREIGEISKSKLSDFKLSSSSNFGTVLHDIKKNSADHEKTSKKPLNSALSFNFNEILSETKVKLEGLEEEDDEKEEAEKKKKEKENEDNYNGKNVEKENFGFEKILRKNTGTTLLKKEILKEKDFRIFNENDNDNEENDDDYDIDENLNINENLNCFDGNKNKLKRTKYSITNSMASNLKSLNEYERLGFGERLTKNFVQTDFVIKDPNLTKKINRISKKLSGEYNNNYTTSINSNNSFDRINNKNDNNCNFHHNYYVFEKKEKIDDFICSSYKDKDKNLERESLDFLYSNNDNNYKNN